MRPLIELPELPELRRPFLLFHLAGWTDAGLAGETATVFLRARWNARTLAEFDSDELLDYRARRPVVRIAAGVVESVAYAPIEVAVGDTGAGRDVVLLTGPEPDFRWRAFSDEVVRVCAELGMTEAFGLGGFPAPSLHTNPIAVIGTSADPELARRLEVVPSVVELAGGIHSVLEERLHHEGIPTTGLWARVPPYLAGGAHPPAALALVQGLSRLTGIEVDLTELHAAAKDHLEQVEAAIDQRPQIKEFIDQVRALIDQEPDLNPGRVPSGEEIAAELERFLADQQPPGEEGRGQGPRGER
jgi:proteasome assembly chaperone (PAC2) family protein